MKNLFLLILVYLAASSDAFAIKVSVDLDPLQIGVQNSASFEVNEQRFVEVVIEGLVLPADTVQGFQLDIVFPAFAQWALERDGYHFLGAEFGVVEAIYEVQPTSLSVGIVGLGQPFHADSGVLVRIAVRSPEAGYGYIRIENLIIASSTNAGEPLSVLSIQDAYLAISPVPEQPSSHSLMLGLLIAVAHIKRRRRLEANIVAVKLRHRLLTLFCLAILPSVSAAQLYAADLNSDGRVDILDLSIVANCQRAVPPFVARCAVADVNGDSLIDMRDLSIVREQFGKVDYPLTRPFPTGDWLVNPEGGPQIFSSVLRVKLKPGLGREDARAIAAGVGGIIGEAPGLGNASGQFFRFDLQRSSFSELSLYRSLIQTDSRVDWVTFAFRPTIQQIRFDPDSVSSSAYTNLRVQGAWRLFGLATGTSTPVGALVLENVYGGHQDFDGGSAARLSSSWWGFQSGLTQWPLNPETDPGSCYFGDEAHGTAVAGIIAGELDGIGLNGVLSGAGLPKSMLYGTTEDDKGDSIKLLKLIAKSPVSVKVANVSWGHNRCPSPEYNQPFPCRRACTLGKDFDALREQMVEVLQSLATTRPDIAVVVAAGNGSNRDNRAQTQSIDDVIPAGIKLPNVIVVGATENVPASVVPARRASYSAVSSGATTSTVDISAIGNAVIAPSIFQASPIPPHDLLPGPLFSSSSYSLRDGTSFAAPLVSGIYGLMKAAAPMLSPRQAVELMRLTGTEAEASISGKRVDALAAVACAMRLGGWSINPDLIADAAERQIVRDTIARRECQSCGFNEARDFLFNYSGDASPTSALLSAPYIRPVLLGKTFATLRASGTVRVPDWSMEELLALKPGTIDRALRVRVPWGDAKEGTVCYRRFQVEVGDRLEVFWNLVTQRNQRSRDDFAFVSVSGPQSTEASVLALTSDARSEAGAEPRNLLVQTGWDWYSKTFDKAGYVVVGFGVMSQFDSFGAPLLLLDAPSLIRARR